MEMFLLGFIVGEILNSYVAPILQALGEEILLKIERRKSYILGDIKIINEEMEIESPEEKRIIGFSTEDGDYKNGNDCEEEENTTEEEE